MPERPEQDYALLDAQEQEGARLPGSGSRTWPMHMFLVTPQPSPHDSGGDNKDDVDEQVDDDKSPNTVYHHRAVRRSVLASLVTSSVRPSINIRYDSLPTNPNSAPRSPPTSVASISSIPHVPRLSNKCSSPAALQLVLDSFGTSDTVAPIPHVHAPQSPTSPDKALQVVGPRDLHLLQQQQETGKVAAQTDTMSTAAASGRKRSATQAVGEDAPQRYKKRPYGHSCLACRERKIKCEEVDNPPCRGCRETNTVCEPVERVRVPRQNKDTEAVLIDFEKRIKRLESMAESNGNIPDDSIGGSVLEHQFSPRDAKREIRGGATSSAAGEHRHSEEEHRRGSVGTVTVGTRAPANDAIAQPNGRGNSSEGNDGDDAHSVEDTLGKPRYVLGSAARPEYHGELSMFDDSGTRPTAPASPRFDSTSPTNWTEERLRAAARLRHRYATADEAEQWLDAYFSWASPVYAVVHRPIFIRDMALDGPYFSEFLLIVIYISGIRFSAGLNERDRAARGEQYVSLAMSMLADEAMGEPRIPTIQALLGLAGRQGAVGKTNQAWMLTGMAIRMMQDMGIHLPVEQNIAAQKFNQEDRDMRTRLFWSAYCWDKSMSLTLGREPSLASRPGFLPDSLPEDTDDDSNWSPYLPEGTLPLEGPYPKRKLLKTFTLRHFSGLNLILESILTNMYSPSRPNARSLSFIRSAVDRLDTWRKQLPEEIKIESHSLPAISPPANTVILNLLYHTIRILIYRPLLTANNRSAQASGALTHCRNASSETAAVLALWGQTFGHFNHHFLFVYSCFISAGVDILLIRTGNPFVRDEAFQRVHLSLDILEQASTQGPGIRRGIANIRAQLDRATRGQLSFPKEPVFPKDVEATGNAAPPDTFVVSEMDEDAGSTAHSTAAAHAIQAQQDMTWFADGDLWDHQTLLDILSAAPISTEDPFAFTESSLLPF